MAKKSPLRSVIGAIQPNKPRIASQKLPEEVFSHPAPSQQGEQTQGELPQVEQPQDNLTQGNGSQGNSPPGEEPHGKSPQSDSIQGKRPHPKESYDLEVDEYLERRKKKRRETLTETALDTLTQLSPESQEKQVKELLSEGWARFVYCVLRQLRAPTRFGFKLVDVTLILTVYDKTIGQITPRMYAPITTGEFEEETGMDASNIRAALRELLRRQVVTKITYKNLNFWGINLSYFEPKKRVNLPHGNKPQGQSPQGNSPSSRPGDLPQDAQGQTTSPQTASSSETLSENASPQNLNLESKKESLSYKNEFPEDLKARWSVFESSGKFANSKKEREIFQELFVTHGSEFFSLCGSVIKFLEAEGNGKSGDDGNVYNPMAYLRGHWERNLARYRTWHVRQEELKQTEARKAKYEEEQVRLEQTREQEFQAKAGRDAQMQADLQRLFRLYQTEAELTAFAEEALAQAKCEFTLNSWRKQGWESPLVQCCVVNYFLKTEAAQNPASPNSSNIQATA